MSSRHIPVQTQDATGISFTVEEIPILDESGRLPTRLMSTDLKLTDQIQYLYQPTASFSGILLSGDQTVVDILDSSNNLLGTFILDTVGQVISTDFMTRLSNGVKISVVSGTGVFEILATVKT